MRHILQTSVISLLSFSLLLLEPTTAYAADDGAQGKVLADSGFRPKPNGFGFANWGGDEYPYSDLTAIDAVALFGERVCARWEGETCVPSAATKAWLKEMNEMMKGGHCEGMAALSAAFHVKQEQPVDYGAKQAFELSPKDKELMSTISTYFATQAIEPVQSITAETRDWPLQKIVDSIVATIAAGRDYPTLGIYGADGGHAITPYMVTQLGDGLYRIYVYDNNYPGAEKFVEVDTKKGVWVYAGAALNPREDPAPWEGGQGAMDLTLLSARYEPLACPFCGSHTPPRRPASPPPAPNHPRKPSVSSDSYSVITPNRCSLIQATRKKDKKQLSRGKSGAKNEIKGASMTSLRGSRGCYVRLPANEQYDVQLVSDGRPVSSALTNLFIFAMGEVYGVSNIALSGSKPQVFNIGSSGFSYQAGGSQKPTLIVASDRSGPNAYYEVSGFTLTDGFEFSAQMDDKGAVSFSDNDPNLDSFDVQGEVITETSSEELDFVDLSASDAGDVELELEADGDVDVDIDSDGDGTEDEKDADDDNDGTPDAKDTDDDNDGTLDDKEVEDADHDGSADAQDTDDDNDGTPDAQDTDDDGDGTPDDKEDGDEAAAASDDSDHDGQADDSDADDDNDGTPDAQDADDDGDGTPDTQEDDDSAADEDTDHDGTPDEQDTDDDNDGSPDSQDSDDDNDGTADSQESDDGGDDTAEEPESGADEPAGGDDHESDAGGEESGGDEE
jgi:hypothetical protein